MGCLILSCSKNNAGSPSPATGAADTLYNWIKSSAVSNELEDIWFTDIKTGFILSSGSVFSSVDSGNSWTKIPNTDNFQAFNMQFIDGQHGYVQSTTQLASTSDGGQTWTLKTLPSGHAFTFQFLTTTTGYYSDYTNGIYKTADGGKNWNLILNGAGMGPNFIFYFPDSVNGFVMINANCSKTNDGGASWHLLDSNITTPNFTNFYKMQFLDTLYGYCATPNGLFKTTDGGKSWNNMLARQTTFMVPYFLDKNNGYCIAANTLYKTTNGGTSWTVSCQLGKDDFSGMYFFDVNTGWATTFGGYLLKLKP
jgi:photosystem II stability/assembly factor-like uncharacterized protein